MAPRKKSELKPEPEPTVIENYLGWPVVATTIAVRNAGDGLSKGMEIDPEVLAPGSTVIVVLECAVDAHDYKKVKDEDAFELVQVLKAGTALIMDAAVVREALASQAEKLKRAAEKSAGVVRLELTDEDRLLAEHERGEHTELRGGCPECDEEGRLSEEGN